MGECAAGPCTKRERRHGSEPERAGKGATDSYTEPGGRHRKGSKRLGKIAAGPHTERGGGVRDQAVVDGEVCGEAVHPTRKEVRGGAAHGVKGKVSETGQNGRGSARGEHARSEGEDGWWRDRARDNQGRARRGRVQNEENCEAGPEWAGDVRGGAVQRTNGGTRGGASH